MEYVIHRINTIGELHNIPQRFGCEIDIRTSGSNLILHHDPFKEGERLDHYLDHYQHGLLVLNEPIELAKNYISLTDWVWIDTNTQLPVNAQNIEILNNFKTCLVCPERWNRPQDILPYRLQMQKLRWQPTAVMTNIACMHEWEKSL